MLFSEPKIPQTVLDVNIHLALKRFSALQRAENSSNGLRDETRSPPRSFSALQRAENSSKVRRRSRAGGVQMFQCSSASRKFLKAYPALYPQNRTFVSVLFSEPKIPQIGLLLGAGVRSVGFSALQRAENSSKKKPHEPVVSLLSFQCSSASRKFLKLEICRRLAQIAVCFSALQRAENSSNPPRAGAVPAAPRVSVLFSEPKIPQSCELDEEDARGARFSALQRAENSSNAHVGVGENDQPRRFSALQRAENSSKSPPRPRRRRRACVSVLFSEPKIPQTAD